MGLNVIEDRFGDCSEQICETIAQSTACVLEIDLKKKNYQRKYHDADFEQFLKPEGTLKELYCILFMVESQIKDDTSRYNQFIDENVFGKDKYYGEIQFLVDGREKNCAFYFLKVSNEKSIVLFINGGNFLRSNQLELEKIDTIQESYLFSMIVNLANDTCMNPNTTEISAKRQDFMEITYSDWRLMISNMFKDEDKVLFLRASSPENIINTLEMQSHFHLDLQMRNMQGEFIWCRLRFFRMKDFSRENPRFVYTVQDISEDMTQLLRQEGLIQAIEEQNERLQEAEQSKTKFLSNMSHEIRTPINAIMGMNEVILRDCKDEGIREYAMEVKNASQYLLSLINDILDYSKIDAGKMEIVPVEYNIEDLVKNVSNMVKPKLTLKALDFQCKVAENVPRRLFGDEIRISQILINLLANAVKYTKQGKITLTIERDEDENGQVGIRFSVSDTGIGIKPEDMERLFQEYVRFDLVKNRDEEGTGLGLCIVQGLLTQMKSRLRVESVYGEGSTFWFVLLQKEVIQTTPVAVEIPKQEPKPKVRDGKTPKVLVVDDTAVNLRIIEALLAPYDLEVYCAKNGKKALAMMKKEQYDLILLDHIMPEMDGIAVLHALRQIDAWYEKVPVIALTANYSLTASEEYISLGFTDYMDKPLVLDRLDELLYKYLQVKMKEE
ncbi:MAG: ATP-binding protein [Wujia sp.]